MNRERNELKAGAFIVLTFVLAVCVVVWIKGAGVGPAQVRTVQFRLTDDLGGLRVGDEVRLGGFKCGVVTDIHPDALGTKDARILVTVSLPSQYALHPNAVVRVQSGLTGVTNVNIENAGTGAALGPGQLLTGKGDPKTELLASLGRIGPHLEQTVDNVKDTASSANTLLKHANAQVDPVVARYNKVADNVSGLVADNRSEVHSTIENLNSATGTIKQKLPAIADQVQAVVAKVDRSLSSAQSALEDVKKTAANARDITATLRTIIVENHTKLDGMIASIKTTSDNLKGASVEIRRSPWRLLYKPTPGEAANLNLYDSAREFAEGAGSLSDAAGALRDAMHDPNADRAQMQKLIDQLDASFNHFHQVENKLWATAK